MEASGRCRVEKGLVEKELAQSRRAGAGFEAVVPNPKLKLMDQMREVLRLRHYSIRTEQSYCDWVRRYVKFHGMQSREQLFPAEGKVEQFLSDLAVNGHVAASTQNQAFNALLFLYREVLHQAFENVQAARSICRAPWTVSILTRPRNGAGSMFSPRGTCRWKVEDGESKRKWPNSVLMRILAGI